MHQLHRSHLLRTLICSVILITLLIPALSFAESAQKLVHRLPGSNKLVIGVEVSAVKNSPLYKETMDWVRTQSNLTELLTLLESEGGFSIDKDLQSLAMVSPELPTSVDRALKIPFTVALSGKFDREKITTAIKTKFPEMTERKEAKVSVLTTDKHDLGFVDDQTLVIVSGAKPYQTSSWQGLTAKKSNHNSKFGALVNDVASEHGMWVLMDSAATSADNAQGAKANFSAMAVRLADNLGLTLLSHFKDPKAAELALQETEKMKAEAQGNPMVTMMGLGPLLKNMAIKQDKSKVWITSSMTVAEARSLLTRVRNIAERSQSLKANPAASKTTPKELPPTKTNEASRPAPKTGAAADFN